jgi:hypothetical protein
MRVYAAVFVLCTIAALLTSEPCCGAEQHQESATANWQSSAPTVKTEKNYTEASNNAEAAHNSSPSWCTALKKSEWWLVIIAALTGIAIAYQAREMKRATKAMQMSTHLQESGLRQWVQVAKLHGGEEGNVWEDGITHVIFYFDVWNPTDRLLTLTSLKWVIGTTHDKTVLNDTIPPNGAYPAMIDHELVGADLDAYKTGKPREISITGEIAFIDALERKQVQPFNVWFHYVLGTGVIMERYYSTAAWVLAETLRAKQKKERQ